MDLIPHDTKIDFLARRHLFLALSAALALSIAVLIPFRVHPGVDFAGGAEIDVKFSGTVTAAEVRRALESDGFSGVTVQSYGPATESAYLVHVGHDVTQGLAQRVSNTMRTAFAGQGPQLRRVGWVGPQVGAQLRNQGIMSVLISMLAISVYIAFRFQAKFAPGAVISSLHDLAMVMGYYVVTGREFNLTSIAVLLTVVGYSINDKVVIYDRVRELEAKRTGKSLEQVINQAVNRTLSRTIIQSGVTALSLVGLLIYGVGSIQDFAGAMLVGILSGTYSSIYIAGPIAIWYERWQESRSGAQHARRTAPAAPRP